MIRQALLILSLFTLLAPTRAQVPAFVQDSLDIWVEREMARWNVPGLAVCIVKDGEVVVEKGYGVRSVEQGGKVDQHTLFMIASNSKIFAGTLLALAEHEGKLSLQDTVVRWLPWFSLSDPEIGRRVNLTDLITHRLGLKTFQGDFLHWASPLSSLDLVRRMRFLPLHTPFRTAYGYCNVGYIAAGLVLEKATGRNWHTAVDSTFFQPLGMTRSSTQRAGIALDPNACVPYTLVRGRLTAMDYPFLDIIGPAASINSSVHDMSRWLIMQLDSGRYDDRQIVPWEVVRKTREAQTVIRTVRSAEFPSRHISVYGLGWQMSDYAGKWICEHGGGADGFVTTTAIVPEAGLGVAVFTNTDQNNLYNALKMQIIDAYLGLPYRNYGEMYWPREEKERKTEVERVAALEDRAAKGSCPTPAEKLTGIFAHPHFGKISVASGKPGTFQIRFSDHQALTAELRPLGGNDFLCTYNVPTYGIQEVRFDPEKDTWFLKVNDFVDYEVYAFSRK